MNKWSTLKIQALVNMIKKDGGDTYTQMVMFNEISEFIGKQGQMTVSFGTRKNKGGIDCQYTFNQWQVTTHVTDYNQVYKELILNSGDKPICKVISWGLFAMKDLRCENLPLFCKYYQELEQITKIQKMLAISMDQRHE